MGKKKKKNKNKKKNLQRDRNIQKHLEGELNLGERIVKDKTKYTRKQKHKNKKYE